ncbi:hypothetical protein BpHYR1_007629 [Brachionus plicatilis]|uniref:Uncharacterized protein n=1 Tax=Brachionus plicatilis TaxID=10195 RepID=A0A3M7RCI5_BRAPC|nr:hypothetical protein BpHYR1_007629 [Brachionus plicatilis]
MKEILANKYFDNIRNIFFLNLDEIKILDLSFIMMRYQLKSSELSLTLISQTCNLQTIRIEMD